MRYPSLNERDGLNYVPIATWRHVGSGMVTRDTNVDLCVFSPSAFDLQIRPMEKGPK